MRRRIAIFGLAMLITPALAAPMAPPGQELTPDQFRTMVVGKTIEVDSTDTAVRTSAVGKYGPDGTLEMDMVTGGKANKRQHIHTSETWMLRGNRVCSTNTTSGYTRCVIFRRVADHFVEVNEDGTLHATVTPVHSPAPALSATP